MLEQMVKALARIKETRPLVLNITNYVTMDFIANGLLCLGASPVMSMAIEEMEELIGIASVVVVNIGTLNHAFIEQCKRACEIANRLKKPIILDPVGSGATQLRTQTCLDLLDHYNIDIVRGNAGEIMSLSGYSGFTKGVDSTAEVNLAADHAYKLSQRYHSLVIVSGEMDMVVKDKKIREVAGGSAMMPQVVGTGCLLTAVVGAFRAVIDNAFDAGVLATTFYKRCGVLAAREVGGPGTFKAAFLDAINTVSEGQKDAYAATMRANDCRV
jgi:hydroxyethylthiazole kinase